MLPDAGIVGRRVRNTNGVLVGVVVDIQPIAATSGEKVVVRDATGRNFDLDPFNIAAIDADVWLKGPRDGFLI